MTTVLPTPAPPKAPTLPPFEEGADQVNHLDAGGQHLGGSGLVHQRRGRAVDGIALLRHHRAAFVHGVADDVEDAAHGGLADGHGNGRPGVENFVSAFEALGGAHADGADPVVAEMLLDFECLPGLALARNVEFDAQGIVNSRKLSRKFNIHDGSDNLDDLAFIHCSFDTVPLKERRLYRAARTVSRESSGRRRISLV